MGLPRRFRRGCSGAAAAEVAAEQPRTFHHDGGKPLGKIIVRLRPMLQGEVNQGETLCVTARGYGKPPSRADVA